MAALCGDIGTMNWRKELIMQSRPAVSQSKKAKQSHAGMWHRGLSYMSEKADSGLPHRRDVLRRIQRTSSFVTAQPNSIPDLRESSK
jgi:hypothetical protein